MKKSVLWSTLFALLFTTTSCLAQSIISPDAYRKPLLDRFLAYTQVDSQSVYGPNNTFVLSPEVSHAADLLYKEIQDIFQKNPSNASYHMSEWKYIYVTFPSNLPNLIKKQIPVLGFSCHYDVTPEAPGHNIKPQIHTNYDGGTIWINQKLNKFINPQTDPYLAQLIGETIITSDGTTLLGGDDKAGTAILMTLIETLAENPKSILHGDLQIVFTPNEDVGQSAEHLDLTYYNPQISFDFDGEVNGEIMAENFTAVGYDVEIPGRQAHPSHYKEQNGLDPNQVASKFIAQIPDNWWPQHSEGHQPYLHPYSYVKSAGDTVYIKMRSRYFDAQDGALHERKINELADSLSKIFSTTIKVIKSQQYENVAYGIHPLAKSVAEKAVRNAGFTPKFISVRGGTTTAMFNAKWGITGYTYFTGQQRIHSTYEWLSEKDMFLAYKTALNTIDELIRQSAQAKK